METNYNNSIENKQVQPYLYAVINLGHSAISGMLAYKDGACIVPICLKSYPSIGVFHHGLLKNATAFREKISCLLNDFETEIYKQFKESVELTKIYVGISPISMQLIDWTYSRDNEQAEVITKGIMSQLNEDCLDDFLKEQEMKRGNNLLHIASLNPVYYVDKDYDTPCTAESIDRLTKQHIKVKQQMLCAKEKYVKIIKEQIQSINKTKELEIKFLGNPLVEAKQLQEEECQDYIYVNIGAGSTSIFMTDKGFFYKMFIYPMGGLSVTNDIQKFFRVSTELAEQLKIRYTKLDSIKIDGTIETAFKHSDIKHNDKSYSISNLNKLVFVRMREILLNVKTYIKKNYPRSSPNKIVFYGGGTKFCGFEQLIKYLEFDFCDVEIVSDIQPQIEQILSNIHNLSWDSRDITNEQIFTLISLTSYISSMDNYLSEEQGYSVHINQAISVEEDEEYQAPVRRRARKTNSVADKQAVIQEDFLEQQEEVIIEESVSETESEEQVSEEQVIEQTELPLASEDNNKASIEETIEDEVENNDSNEEESVEEVISSDDILGNYF